MAIQLVPKERNRRFAGPLCARIMTIKAMGVVVGIPFRGPAVCQNVLLPVRHMGNRQSRNQTGGEAIARGAGTKLVDDRARRRHAIEPFCRIKYIEECFLDHHFQ